MSTYVSHFLASCDPSHTSCGKHISWVHVMLTGPRCWSSVFKECNSIPCALAQHLENYSIPCSCISETSKAEFWVALLFVLVSYLGVPAYKSDHSNFLQQYTQSPGVARISLHQTLSSQHQHVLSGVATLRYSFYTSLRCHVLVLSCANPGCLNHIWGLLAEINGQYLRVLLPWSSGFLPIGFLLARNPWCLRCVRLFAKNYATSCLGFPQSWASLLPNLESVHHRAKSNLHVVGSGLQ